MPKKNQKTLEHNPDQEQKEEIKKELAVQPHNPMTLIQQAIENKVDVATMEKLMDLQERWEKNMAKKAFDEAMAGFQAECPIIGKTNSVEIGKGGYKYASLDEIVTQVKDLLAKHGFSYTFDTKKTDHSIITYCKVKHKLGHTEVSEFEITIDTSSRMNVSQKDGSASSYGKRYAFNNAFGILTGDEDNDANSVGQTAANSDEMFKTAQTMITKETSAIKILNYQKKIESSEKYSELQKTALMGLCDKRLAEIQKSDDIPVIEEGQGTTEPQ